MECGVWVGEQVVDLSGDVAFEAADDLSAGFSFCSAFLDVVDCWLVPAHAGGSDPPECVVGLAVPSPVETMAHDTAGRGLDRAHTAQRSEGVMAIIEIPQS